MDQLIFNLQERFQRQENVKSMLKAILNHTELHPQDSQIAIREVAKSMKLARNTLYEYMKRLRELEILEISHIIIPKKRGRSMTTMRFSPSFILTLQDPIFKAQLKKYIEQ